MQLAIWGAGAIGGTIGAWLVKSGQDVLFVDKAAAHVKAMNTNGLEVTGAAAFQVPVTAAFPRDVHGPLEVVLLAVKSQHTQEALRQLIPRLDPSSAGVSLQNGLNEEKIAASMSYGAKRQRILFLMSQYWASLSNYLHNNRYGRISDYPKRLR